MPNSKDNSWRIAVTAPYPGFAPSFWKNSYPNYGNSNHAGDIQNCDITDPTKITQGAGLATLTAGTQAGAVTTLIKHILNVPTSADVAWGIGGAKLYKISATAVANAGSYPHTIDKAAVTGEDGESVCSDGTYLYYFYNHSGSAGDMGRLTLATDAFDDDFGSTVPTGFAALQNAPHPSVLGDDGIVYFGNGRYVGYYDPVTNTISVDELDLPAGSQVVDLVYENSKIYAAVNFPNLTGVNNNQGSIYVWDTVSDSWDDFPHPRVYGRLGALINKDGNIFVFYQDLSSSGGFKLGVLDGNKIKPLRTFTGSLPNFGQKIIYDNMIAWISSGEVWIWGSADEEMPTIFSQHADGGFATVGAFAAPFGTPMCASFDGATSYKLAKFSGYDVNCAFKSLMFSCATSMIDKVIAHFEPTATGARADLLIHYNRGNSNQSITKQGQTGSITHTNDTGTIKKIFNPNINNVDDWRIEIDWSNGSATNALAIRMIEVFGHWLQK